MNEVTGLTKSQREFAVHQNMGGFDLLIYKRLLKEKQPCTAEDLEIVRGIWGDRQELLQLLDRCGVRRGLNYIQKQKKLYPKDSFNDISILWKDYLEECRTLDYDLSDRYNLMPPDLRKAHNKTMELVARRKNKANDDKIARRLPELEEKYHFEADNLLIRPAHTAGELVAEGKLLHHCVGSYVERYAKGETNARPWKNLSDTNLLTISGKTDAALFKELVKASGAAKGKYSSGDRFWVMSDSTKANLTANALSINAAGAIVSGMNESMPVIGGTIETLDFIPDGVIIGGYGSNYLLAEREGASMAQSEHVRFLDDQTVFKGTARYDGIPVIAEAFVAISINGTKPAADAVTFTEDSANKADGTSA